MTKATGAGSLKAAIHQPHRKFPAAAQACCLLAIPLFTGSPAGAAEIPSAATASAAQAASGTPADKIPAGPPQITYVGGQLTIRALNAPLAGVLARVSTLLGITIDLPDDSGELMPIVLLGPGPAREVLASLLSGAHFEYMIQASETDAEKLQSVLILPRKKPGSDASATDPAAPLPRSPYGKPATPPPEPEEAAASNTAAVPPAAPAPNGTSADAANTTPQTQPDGSVGVPTSQRDPLASATPKSGQLTPPADLSPQGMSQQLQQMYQQRMQILQQSRTAAQSSAQQQ